MTAPLIKWAGGKAWLVSEIAPRIEAVLRGRYIEPFTGGAAVALAVSHPKVLNDRLEILIDMYRAVRDTPTVVARLLSKLIRSGIDKEAYLRVRRDRPRSPAQRAAWLLYVNRLGFNGLYRENRSGEFNVPYGSPGQDPFDVVFERLPAVSAALRGATLTAEDFRAVIAAARAGDVVYADPPYDGTFTAYTAAQFTAEDQRDLALALRAASERGVTVFATNADTGLVRALYGEWARIEPTREPRVISSKPDDRTPAPCVLIQAP